MIFHFVVLPGKVENLSLLLIILFSFLFFEVIELLVLILQVIFLPIALLFIFQVRRDHQLILQLLLFVLVVQVPLEVRVLCDFGVLLFSLYLLFNLLFFRVL